MPFAKVSVVRNKWEEGGVLFSLPKMIKEKFLTKQCPEKVTHNSDKRLHCQIRPKNFSGNTPFTAEVFLHQLQYEPVIVCVVLQVFQDLYK